MLDHEIMLTRAQAIVDGDAETIVLCDIACKRPPNPLDRRKLTREVRDRLSSLTPTDARAELDRVGRPVILAPAKEESALPSATTIGGTYSIGSKTGSGFTTLSIGSQTITAKTGEIVTVRLPSDPHAVAPGRWYTPDAAGDCLVCRRGEGEHARGAFVLPCPPEDVARARCEADRNADAAATSLESCIAGREDDRLEAMATFKAVRAELADLHQRLIGMTRVASLATRDMNAAIAREGIANAKHRAAVMRTIPRDASWVLPDRIVEESAIILDQAIEPWRDPSPLASPDGIQAAIGRATESITGRPYAVVTSDLEDPPGCRRDDCWIYTTCKDPDHCPGNSAGPVVPAQPKPPTPAAVAITSASGEAMPAEEIAFAVASVRAGVRRYSAPLVALAALADLVEQWIAATKDLQIARAGLRPGQVTTASEEAATRVDELERALKMAVRRG